MLALLVIMFSNHVYKRLSSDGQGVDLVIGAKGSPLQLILSSIYHVDLPVGNIPYAEAKRWMGHPQVKQAIPLALGDNWHGFRIVGTTADYLSLYGAVFQDGKTWESPFEAVAGSATGLRLDMSFSGAHGLMEGGDHHEGHPYRVVGILKPTGTVLDRLILTSVDSVLVLHGQHDHDYQESQDEDEHSHTHDSVSDENGHEHEEEQVKSDDDHSEEIGMSLPEITAVLLKVKSPLAAMSLPHTINRESSLQAANPALEMARLSGMLGVGSKSLGALSFLLIAIAALSIFSGLASTIDGRMGELAVLRAIGYSRRRLIGIVLAEGLIITISGIILGLALGVACFRALVSYSSALDESQAFFDWSAPGLAEALISIFFAGLVSAIIPALRAGRIDISAQLARVT
ncbi:MAG: ABC transporter permease [Alphaproteobacteria bacterium]|nr:ABC transporter permease [Alphaproteobacteria bacterium]MBP7757698.1 ABC transporter permease [Alphaproteobacteria bacterium]MBP7761102.1 ABC transporter permease [Alphaproteobacteria bacterium]MBP7904712.1 ABC transporter permease [Alphaproteobacteria bacterium]